MYMIPILYMYSDIALFFLRVVLGIVFITHGSLKIKDLTKTKDNFASMGFKPAVLLAPVVACAEFGGGVLLLIGFWTQIVALILAIQFVVILFWRIRKKQSLVGGYELDLIILAALILLASAGSLVYSIDGFFFF